VNEIPKTKAELNEILQEIWTYAPDRFDDIICSIPPRPTMESDYEELRKGVDVVFRQKRFNDRRPELKNLVEESYLAFTAGNKEKGMDIISEIIIMIGKMK